MRAVEEVEVVPREEEPAPGAILNEREDPERSPEGEEPFEYGCEVGFGHCPEGVEAAEGGEENG